MLLYCQQLLRVKKGIQKADLYTYKGTVCANPDEVVSHGTCAPAVAIFVKTIEVEFKNK